MIPGRQGVSRFICALACLTLSLSAIPSDGQEKPIAKEKAPSDAPAEVRLTLEEAKERALASNKLLNLAGLNVEAKGYAIRAMKANYFPQVAGALIYMHFQDDLGSVITGGGR